MDDNYAVVLIGIFQVLNANFGSYYVNDFNKFGRVYRVYIQAETDRREAPSDIGKIYVRNRDGEMIPMRFSATSILRNWSTHLQFPLTN